MSSHSFIAQPTSRVNIRNLSNFLREKFGMFDQKYFPVVEVLELILPQLYKDFHYEIESIKDMGSRHGETIPQKSLIRIREDVYLNACDGIGRDRFTIAHEIGHLFMHHPKNMSLARTDKKQSIPKYCDPEWQAHTFAGELLAPPHIINGLSIPAIMKYCGVSESVAEIQRKQC